MRYIKKINGEIVEGPAMLSGDRTAAPNTAWKADQLAAYGYELIEDLAPNPEDVFSVEVFQETLFGALMQGQFSNKKVRNEFDKLCAFLTGTKRLDMMKQYLGWLVSESEITESDYAVVAGILALQNINLGDY